MCASSVPNINALYRVVSSGLCLFLNPCYRFVFFLLVCTSYIALLFIAIARQVQSMHGMVHHGHRITLTRAMNNIGPSERWTEGEQALATQTIETAKKTNELFYFCIEVIQSFGQKFTINVYRESYECYYVLAGANAYVEWTLQTPIGV